MRRTVGSETGRPALVGLVLTLAFVAAWALLAVLRPTVTYHLAPALVALAIPYSYWRSRRLTVRTAVLAAVAGGAVAILTTVGLGASGHLAGPVLFGADATTEGLVVAGAASATAAASGTSLVLLRSRADRRHDEEDRGRAR